MDLLARNSKIHPIQNEWAFLVAFLVAEADIWLMIRRIQVLYCEDNST